MEQRGKQRSSYWDNIKGLLMLLTVFAHILFPWQDRSEFINRTVDCIYLFHMPAFVFVSGFFGKSERSRSFGEIIKLIVLYFIFNSVMGFTYGFTSLLQPMYSYWYLVALVVWRLTAHYIAKFRWIQLILFVIAVFAGFYPDIDNTFAAARIIGFYPYYMMGYRLDEERSAELVSRKYSKRAVVGIPAALVTAVMSFAAAGYFQYTDDALQMAAYDDPLGPFGRIVLYVTAFMAVCVLRYLSPDRNIPLLTMFGRYSLSIFILHRPITLLLSDHIPELPVSYMFIVAVLAAFVICMALGNGFTAKVMDRFAREGAEIFVFKRGERVSAAKIASLFVSLWFIVSLVIGSYAGSPAGDRKTPEAGETLAEDDAGDIRYPVMTDEQKQSFENAFRITFAGDLILLEDQVKRAYNGKGYDFSEVFEYAEPYISSADFAVGVFEGPMAGGEAGYTSSNYDDGKTVCLNFPDEFARAVRDAGFDLVTTANNHLLDKGEDGALRTIDVLDGIGLDHTGSYKNAQDKKSSRIKQIECQGMKIAVLSYTYGSNNIDNSRLVDGEYSYLTSVISGTEGEQFEKLKRSVEEDFREAKQLSPDLIVVLPHMGTQFSNEADEEQKVWFEIFKENGADIILGDHPHVVEPVQMEEYAGRNVFTAYCPGNFANIYRENQGDTSMLIDVYIDRDTKQVMGGAVIPLYTHARADGNYRAVPIYDIMTDTELRKQLSTDDIERAAEANDIVTEVVFGHKMDISSVTERYYFNENGFMREKAGGLTLTEERKSGTLCRALERAESVCFIGDSVTEGTKNGGCPWYEPIEEYLGGKEVLNYSKGSCTVSYMTDRTDDIPDAGLYVIALGTNDVRYRDESTCAMTADHFVAGIAELKKKLALKVPDAEFVFIAPWYSTDGDPFCKLSYAEKTALNEEYSQALENYCQDNGFGFINANYYIRNVLAVSPDRLYLLDHIHPNSSNGVVMYSEAVLSGG